MRHPHVAAAEITEAFAEREVSVQRNVASVFVRICRVDLGGVVAGGKAVREHRSRRVRSVPRPGSIETFQQFEVYFSNYGIHVQLLRRLRFVSIFRAYFFHTLDQIFCIFNRRLRQNAVSEIEDMAGTVAIALKHTLNLVADLFFRGK